MRSHANMRHIENCEECGQERLTAIARLWRTLIARLVGLISAPDAIQVEQRARAASYESHVLRQALYMASQCEIDWLLSASLMTDPAKRRYCLKRALALNPQSEIASRALARLSA